jgi:hypothetical protein
MDRERRRLYRRTCRCIGFSLGGYKHTAYDAAARNRHELYVRKAVIRCGGTPGLPGNDSSKSDRLRPLPTTDGIGYWVAALLLRTGAVVVRLPTVPRIRRVCLTMPMPGALASSRRAPTQ